MSFILLSFGVVAPLSAQANAALDRAAGTITAADVARHIGVIADDSMLGRKTPSPQIELTARYVADQFQKAGLKPGGDSGTWFQRYPLPSDPSQTAPNTIGIVEGSDPQLRDQYIVYTAHMDHLGVSSGSAPDSVNNGADDNGSGTAALLELAQAFRQPGARPRRSVMLIAFSGEEEMGWGSRYFIAHPTRPLAHLIGEINLDMIGRNAADSVEVLGQSESDLGAAVGQVAAAHPELRLKPATGRTAFTYDSDHYFFAKAGIPTVFLHTGLHADYHQVTDNPDRLDTDKTARVARLAFYAGYLAANNDQPPAWNALGRQHLAQEQKSSQEDAMQQLLRQMMQRPASSGPKP